MDLCDKNWKDLKFQGVWVFGVWGLSFRGLSFRDTPKNEPLGNGKYPTSFQVKPIQTLITQFELKSIEEENPDAKEH